MLRYLAAALALWALLLLLHLQAVGLWTWGPLDPVVRGLSRAADVAAVPFGLAAARVLPRRDRHYSTAHYVVRTGLAALCLPLLALGLRDVARRRLKPAPDGLSRRTVLLAAPAALGVWAVAVEPDLLQVRRYEVPVPGLPPDLDGLRLGHVSDTHCGPYISPQHIARALRLVSAESPDLLVLTGDYVHRTPAAIVPGIAVLAEGRARLGAVAVLGNHDHWEGAEGCRAELRRHGIPLLDNDRLFLSRDGLHAEPGPGRLALCGVGDLWEDQVMPEQALRDVPPDMPRVLLSHNPDVAELYPHERFHLQLSGHTHGGQVAFPLLGTPLVPSAYGQKYAGGLVQGPAWPVVVSRGVGMALTPVRLGVPPEVVLVVLRRAGGA